MALSYFSRTFQMDIQLHAIPPCLSPCYPFVPDLTPCCPSVPVLHPVQSGSLLLLLQSGFSLLTPSPQCWNNS